MVSQNVSFIFSCLCTQLAVPHHSFGQVCSVNWICAFYAVPIKLHGVCRIIIIKVSIITLRPNLSVHRQTWRRIPAKSTRVQDCPTFKSSSAWWIPRRHFEPFMTTLCKSLPEGITHSSLLCNVKQGGYQGKPENALKDTSDHQMMTFAYTKHINHYQRFHTSGVSS